MLSLLAVAVDVILPAVAVDANVAVAVNANVAVAVSFIAVNAVVASSHCWLLLFLLLLFLLLLLLFL